MSFSIELFYEQIMTSFNLYSINVYFKGCIVPVLHRFVFFKNIFTVLILQNSPQQTNNLT